MKDGTLQLLRQLIRQEMRALRTTEIAVVQDQHPRIAQQYRLNIGTIVEEEMLKVRLASVKKRLGKRLVTGGRVLGELEEWFLSQLAVGDTFLFSGEVLRFEGLDEFLINLSRRAGARNARQSQILAIAAGPGARLALHAAL